MASLTKTAEGILADARRLDYYTTTKGLGYSTFEKDTLSDLPDDLEDCRKSLVDSTQKLKQLAHGPVGLLLETLFFVSLRPCLQDHEHGPVILPPKNYQPDSSKSSMTFWPSASSTTTTSPNTSPWMAPYPTPTSRAPATSMKSFFGASSKPQW